MIEGWLFDVYPVRDGMAVWFLDGEGRPHRLLHRYAPALYLTGERWAVAAAEQALAHLRMHVTMAPAVRRELMSGEEVRVVRVAVHDPLAFPAAARRLAKIPGITLYNCDIPAARLFFYETGLFPLARCAVEHAGGEIRAIETLTRPEDIEYDLPPLVTLRLRLDAETTAANPAHGRRGPFDGACPELGLPFDRLRANGMSDAHPLCRRARGRRLEAGVDGETVVCDGDDPGESIRSLNRLLARYDPDVILTEWGDAVLLPQLRLLAARVGIPLALNRDGGAGIRTRRSRSYTTYGQVVFQAGAQMLAGRWHIDLRNSFIYGESELAGLLEIARLARIPVQDLARTSTGTAISSMQLERAVADGVLIPWQKSEPEAFKTASQLIVTDKGGLTYQPLVGMFEQVGELDFSSMYPTMMARFNVSPETIGCACCPDSRVPEIGYTVCTRRRGLVPRVLDHLLERRAYYKRRKKETSGSARALYDQRQTALKWCLVTCLDGDTLVLHQRDGRWKIGPIREVVEAYLPGLQWGTKPVEGLAVSGVDPDLRSCPKPVKCVIKVPAPPRMIRMKLQWGRELLMTPDHQCYVLADGGLQIKRADQLKGGEWIPIATALALGGLTSEAQSQVDLLQTLQRAFPLEEQERWRVFGGPVRRVVQAQYRELSEHAGEHYAAKTIWNWREYGYLPLPYVRQTDFSPKDRAELSLGRGKLTGGVIQKIPALVNVDENLGFLLGFFVGDGSATGRMLRFAVGANEMEHLRRLRAIIQSKFGLGARWYRERKARMYVLQVNSIALVQVFKSAFGLEGSADRGKLCVPEVVLNGPRSIQRGFILGLIASDGHVSRSRNFACISSASRRFVNELALLLTVLGVEHRFTRHGRLYHLQTKNLEETRKVLYAGAPASRKHLRRLQRRISVARISRLPQIPVQESGLLEVCRAARIARVPRISGVGVVSKATARVKLEQLLQRRHRLSEKMIDRLSPLRRLVGSSLAFARVLSVEEVPYAEQFVYCVQLADAPAGFFTEGGILTHNCFGYLGYRNARFGRIEAHEAVTAYAREMLLRAKEVAEARGFRMLHALVDSMWLQRPGAGRGEYEALAQAVTEATGLPIFVEGVYRWIGFLPSKTHRGVGVPNRYLGVFDDGTTKVRGIEVRRSDVPILVEQMQERLLQRMFRCATLADVQTALPELLAILEEALVRLRAGEVTAEELAVTNRLSQEVREYRHNTVQAIAARTLDRHGARLHPGEAVQFIITDHKAKLPDDRVRPYALLGTDWAYDADAYAEMLVRAAETVLELFGYSRERLRREVWDRVR